MKLIQFLVAVSLFSAMAFSQGSLTQAKLNQPASDSWPTYNGDYSGRRYQHVDQD